MTTDTEAMLIAAASAMCGYAEAMIEGLAVPIFYRERLQHYVARYQREKDRYFEQMKEAPNE